MIPTWLHVAWSIVSIVFVCGGASWTIFFMYPVMKRMRDIAEESLELSRQATQVMEDFRALTKKLDLERLSRAAAALEVLSARLSRGSLTIPSVKDLFARPGRSGEMPLTESEARTRESLKKDRLVVDEPQGPIPLDLPKPPPID